MSVNVEPANYKDLSEVARLEKLIEKENAADLEVITARFTMHPNGFLLARQKDQIIGYAESCIWDKKVPAFHAETNYFSDNHLKNGKILYIIFIGILPMLHRQGIASKLIQSLLSLAHKGGQEKVHAVTWEHLLPLYTNQGFYPVKKMPNFLPVGDFTLLEYLI